MNASERSGATTFKGNPLTLVGPELKAGDKAPDFETVDKGLQPVKLSDTAGKVRIFSVLPSLDTPVCDMQTKRFNEEAAKLKDVAIYTISMDLPFAQKRYCDAYAVDNLSMLSDHKTGSFGEAYPLFGLSFEDYDSLFVEKLGLLLRATTQNRDMAASLGVATRKIDALTFAFDALSRKHPKVAIDLVKGLAAVLAVRMREALLVGQFT